jgi:hypothetical protein
MWDRTVVEKIECVGEFIVAWSFRYVENGFSWDFVGVYRPHSNTLILCEANL